MRFLFAFCYLFLITSTVVAQQLVPVNEKKYADSLSVILHSNASDSIKANTHFLLADLYRSKDTLQSKKHLGLGTKLSLKYPYLKAAASFYEGQYYYNWNKVKAAAAFLNAIKNLKPFQFKESYLLQAASWYNYGIMIKDKEGYAAVMDIVTQHAIPLAEKSGDKEKLSHYNSQFGTILMYNGKFEEAIPYNKKAIDLLSKEYPTSATLVLAYIGAATNLVYADKKDQAKKYLDAAEEILKSFPESVNYPFFYLAKSHYYISNSQFEEALLETEKGIIPAKKNHQKDVLQLLIFRKYEIYLHQQHYTSAKKVLTDLVVEGSILKDVNNKKTIYNELVKINELLHDKQEAFIWLKKYSTLSDSISNARLKETITELEVQYKNAESQKAISALEKETAQNALEADKNKQFLLILAVICMILLLIAIFSYMYYRNYKNLIQQKEINHQQEIAERAQQEQLKVTQAMLSGEEKERGRIAQELHDGLGGMLAGVKINLSGWASLHLRPDERTEFNKIITQLDNSINELRGVARNLMPESLLRFGLETALKDLCNFYTHHELEIDLQCYNLQKDISLATQLHIYRIIQELLSNAVKHAKATAILLQCTQEDSVFLITIEDNGIGFITEEAIQKNGMGLHNVENRIQYLHGKMEITTEVNEGTTINIELKINEHD